MIGKTPKTISLLNERQNVKENKPYSLVLHSLQMSAGSQKREKDFYYESHLQNQMECGSSRICGDG